MTTPSPAPLYPAALDAWFFEAQQDAIEQARQDQATTPEDPT